MRLKFISVQFFHVSSSLGYIVLDINWVVASPFQRTVPEQKAFAFLILPIDYPI